MQKNIVDPKFRWSFKNLLFETIESQLEEVYITLPFENVVKNKIQQEYVVIPVKKKIKKK